MRRRTGGVGAIKKKQASLNAYAKKGSEMEEKQLSFVKSTLEEFRQTLVEFAVKYKDRINEDAEFRHQFHQMCSSINVDPLASSKGFWADLLGVGDYYFEIAVRVVDMSVRDRKVSGGIMPLDDMVRRLNKSDDATKVLSKSSGAHGSSSGASAVTAADVRRAVDKLKVLGSGFRVLDVDGRAMVLSVPTELNKDHQALVATCQREGCVSIGALQMQKKWSPERCRSVVDPLVRDGLVWLDMHHGETFIYFPAFWSTGP
jgi:ESCRT-II complex subunit VPS22